MDTPQNEPIDYQTVPHDDAIATDVAQPTLSERISAAQTRIAESTAPAREEAMERAKAAGSSLKEFAEEHPFLTVAGGLAIGAAIALALPGRPGRKVRGSVLAAGGLLGELASTYGSKMLEFAEDAAQVSQEKLGEIGESFAETGSALGDTIADAAYDARLGIEGAGDSVARRSRSLAARIRR